MTTTALSELSQRVIYLHDHFDLLFNDRQKEFVADMYALLKNAGELYGLLSRPQVEYVNGLYAKMMKEK